MDNIPEDFKSGFVAVMGRPNVGKSTLINRLLGTKIAATSPWPQTTRKTQMGILTLDNAQIIFVDTPGVHNPIHKLGERMNQEALRVIEESDIVLFIVDISQPPNVEDRLLSGQLNNVKRNLPIVLAQNKSDLVPGELIQAHQSLYQELIYQAESITITKRAGVFSR
jgi:GTP-binding protein Era